MKFDTLLRVVGDEPLFESGVLLAGNVDPNDVRRQLSRWRQRGRVLELRRGLYSLAPPYRKVPPHPFLVANRLVRGSYVSCQSALAAHGLIPESVPIVTSVGPGRPGLRKTPLGSFQVHYLKPGLRFGFRFTEVGPGQRALLAVPEKALLDLVHLTPEGDDPRFLRGLRLQQLGRLDATELERQVLRSRSLKLRRAAAEILHLAREESEEYEAL